MDSITLLLMALAMFESGVDDSAVGMNGEVSRYQIRKMIWHQHTISTAYNDAELSEKVARAELAKRINWFVASKHALPDYRSVYALWNAPGRFRKADFKVSRLPKTIRSRCDRFRNVAIALEKTNQKPDNEQ